MKRGYLLIGFEDSDGVFFFWKKKALVVKLFELLFFGVENVWWVDESLRVGKEFERLKPNWVWVWEGERQLIRVGLLGSDVVLREVVDAIGGGVARCSNGDIGRWTKEEDEGQAKWGVLMRGYIKVEDHLNTIWFGARGFFILLVWVGKIGPYTWSACEGLSLDV